MPTSCVAGRAQSGVPVRAAEAKQAENGGAYRIALTAAAATAGAATYTAIVASGTQRLCVA